MSGTTTRKRDSFGSSIGFILATSGSAVGLGNIWRFPYMTGTNGGGAFLLVYAVFMILIGASLLLVEFSIGRNGKANAIESYGKISKKAKWIGYLGFFSAFIFLSYYSVVGGWLIYYSVKSATGLTAVAPEKMGAFFGGFISNPFTPLVFHLIFMVATITIVAKGIAGGIEKYCKILMPMLFVMMLVMVVRSLTLPNALEGIIWYLTPDISKITGKTLVAAMGQVFFSLSVGMAGMVTYASYLKTQERLPQTALKVTLMDSFIALLAGFMIFPAVFSMGMEPGAGPGLIFITLPGVFAQLPFGAVFALIFFVLLFIAALTSSISILEMPVAYLIEKNIFTRKTAAMVVGGIAFVLGIAVSFSFGIWGNFKLFNKNIFELFDYFGSNISLPIGGLAAAIVVGWIWKKGPAISEITNGNTNKVSYATLWFWLVKWVIPITIVLVFMSGIGVL